MENTSIIALSRQNALRRQMDVVAHNMANMNTTAYKGEKMMFVDQLVKSRGGDGRRYEELSFVRDIATMRDTTEGPLVETGNTLDLAVRGEGYFVIDTDDGERYTRNGNFRLDDTGQMVTQQGNPILSDAGAPFFFSPADREITISRDGSVSTENGLLGKVRVVEFENEQALQATANGLYTTTAEPQEPERVDVVQGMLEGSNVNSITELTTMIEVSRAYEGAKNLIERENERLQRAVREIAAEAR